MIDIDRLIQETIKERSQITEDSPDHIKDTNKYRLKVYRNLKSAILNYKTSKKAKEYNDAAEHELIENLIVQCLEQVSNAKKASRDDLILDADRELIILYSLVPDVPNRLTIEDSYKTWRENFETSEEFPKISKKDIGNATKGIKSLLPNCNDKLIREIVKSYAV